jgi:hypothetical protein
MPIPTLTPPPVAPQRLLDGEDDYVDKADDFVSWWVAFATQLITAVGWIADQVTTILANVAAALTYANTATAAATAAVGATGYMARSTDNLTIGVGAKALTTGLVGKTFANADQVTLIDATNAGNRMWGAVSLANMGAGTMTVTVGAGQFAGAGTLANWIVIHRAFEALLGATAADINAEASSTVGITPAALKSAAAPVALAYASTVTPNLANGKRFTLDASASFTLGNATNCAPGDVFEILVTNTAGSIVLAVAGAYHRQNGLFVLDPANGHKNKLIFVVEAVDGSGNATDVTYGGLRNPT